ncbi:MAG: Nitrile hydratase beta subunit [Actinomycetota bacterium]
MTDDPHLIALELPRTNGELVFEEPWQARALGMGVVALRELGIGVVEWRDALAEAIERHGHDPDEDPATAYYAAWVDALERVVAARS